LSREEHRRFLKNSLGCRNGSQFKAQYLGAVLKVTIAACAALVALALPGTTRAEPAGDDVTGFRLLMVEQPGCAYCRIFNRDIAPIYARAPEGRAVPLVHVPLREPAPEGVTLASRPFATPTFILIDPDGTEIDRIVGYAGQDFFWSYLGRMFDRAGVVLPAHDPAGASLLP
jgi:hypothetical protein